MYNGDCYSKINKNMIKKILVIILAIAAFSLFFTVYSKNKTAPQLTQITTADSGKWVGFAPFYLAKNKNLDKKYGLELKIEKVGSSDARRGMLASGQVDFLTPTIDGAVFNINAGMDLKIIMAYDTSFGGDAIVAKNSIKTFADLKGKTVAATKGFTNYFFLKYLMNKNGLQDKDIKILDMPDETIGPAMLAGKIDAGAMMEPWISNVVAQGKGHILISSKETPNVVTDIVLARNDAVKNKQTAFIGLAKAWFDSLEYWKNNPTEANEIMAKEYGMTAVEFGKAIESVRWLDKKDNLAYFGTEDKKGMVFEVTQSIIDVAQAEKIISKQMTASEIIDLSTLGKLR